MWVNKLPKDGENIIHGEPKGTISRVHTRSEVVRATSSQNKNMVTYAVLNIASEGTLG